MNAHNNPTLYRELSKPFAGRELAEQSMEKFFEELAELRKKHRIADVVCVTQVNIQDASGEEGAQIATIRLGQASEHPTILAHALGSIRQEMNQALDFLMSRKTK